MRYEHARPWCIFTSAGNRNSIRDWVGVAADRRWDLIVAYYGDDEREYASIKEVSHYAFRSKGSKFQNLKKLFLAEQNIFDGYSHVWVCDDDIQMSRDQIEQAFTITQTFGFWIAQPAYFGGKVSHWITSSAWPLCDYRIVNIVEVTMPIFRRDKLVEFLSDYDGSLVGFGIDYWFSNYFKANDFGRFAIIDKVRVINPPDAEKGGREIDRLQSEQLRLRAWQEVMNRRGFVEYPYKVFSYARLPPTRDLYPVSLARKFFIWFEVLIHDGWREAIWLAKCTIVMRRQCKHFENQQRNKRL